MSVIIRSSTDRDGCRKWGHLPDLTSFEADAVDTFEEGARMLNVISCQAHLEDLQLAYQNEDRTELQDGAVGDRLGQPVFFFCRQVTRQTPIAQQRLVDDEADAPLSREFYFIDRVRPT